MELLNLDKVACPHCGTSGTKHLEQARLPSDYQGVVKISCPDCGEYVILDDTGDPCEAKGEPHQWYGSLPKDSWL